MDVTWQRAVVIGASSGMGEALARQLAREGTRVALVARRAGELERLRDELNQAAEQPVAIAYPHDVREFGIVPDLFQKIAMQLGGVDLVIYAAGVLPRVANDEYPTAVDLETVSINFNGAVAWLNVAAQRFSLAGSGTLIGISSVAGDRGRTQNPVYGASKAALDSYLSSLRSRLARRGVRVVTVKPGYVRTAQTDGVSLPGFLPLISPERAASEILQAARSGKRAAYVPGRWRWIMTVIRMIPAPLFERTGL